MGKRGPKPGTYTYTSNNIGEDQRGIVNLAKRNPGWIRFIPRGKINELLWALRKRGVVEISPKDGLPAFRLVGDKAVIINKMIL